MRLAGGTVTFSAKDSVRGARAGRGLWRLTPKQVVTLFGKEHCEEELRRHPFFRQCLAPSLLELRVGAQVCR